VLITSKRVGEFVSVDRRGSPGHFVAEDNTLD
jgi:hypothetical protein